MKRTGYVLVSAVLSLLVHLVFLAFADRIHFSSLVLQPTGPDLKVRVSLRDVSSMVMPKPDRQKMVHEAETLLKDAVAKSPAVKDILDREQITAPPPKLQARIVGLGDSLLKPDLKAPPEPRIATAPPPKILEIDGDALPVERQALDRRLQAKVPRYDIPAKNLPSLLPPGPLQGGIGKTLDLSLRMGALPGVPGLRPGDVANLDDDGTGSTHDGTKGGVAESFAPRGGIPGLHGIGETGALERNPLGDEPLEILDDFVSITVTVYPERRGGGYFRADISPNPRSDALRDVAKDILLVIDHSTSISDEKLEQFKAGTVEALQYLNPKDRFDVIAFTESPKRCFGELVPVTPENLDRAQDYVKQLVRGGMTDVFGSLAPFVSQNNPNPDRPLNIFLMSDGNSTVNIREKDEFVRGIVGMNPGNVSIYSFSAGRKANLFLMQFLGYLNRGFSLHEQELKDFRSTLVSYISTHSSLIVSDLRYKTAEGIDDEIFPKRLPHLYRGETLSIFGRYPPGVNELTLSLLGRDGTGKVRELIFRREFDECVTGGREVAQNWAAQKVFHLIGQRTLTTDEETRADVTRQIGDLAQSFGLYVPY